MPDGGWWGSYTDDVTDRLDRLTAGGRRECVRWAVTFADEVLPIFEAIHPADARSAKSLQAARCWADRGKPTAELRHAARSFAPMTELAPSSSKRRMAARHAGMAAWHAWAAVTEPIRAEHSVRAAAWATALRSAGDEDVTESILIFLARARARLPGVLVDTGLLGISTPDDLDVLDGCRPLRDT